MHKIELKPKLCLLQLFGTKIAISCLLFNLLSVAIAAPVVVEELSPQIIQTMDDFEIHIKHHSNNVVILGLHLYDSFPESFKEVDRETLKMFLSLHDISKRMSSEQLRRSGVKRKESFVKSLFKYFGRSKEKLGPMERAEFDRLLKSLNYFDAEVAHIFFLKRNLLDNSGKYKIEAQSLLQIEKIADSVERNANPLSSEEFGRKMKNASAMFSSTEKLFASFLERSYGKIIPTHPLLRTQSCRAIFN